MSNSFYKYKIIIPFSASESNEQLLIRGDYGHGLIYPHIDVEFISSGKKTGIDVKQSSIPNSYDYIINMVLAQAEKFDPKVGPKYWISPVDIHRPRVEYITNAWKNSNLSTSLSVLSRAVNLRCIHAQAIGKTVDDQEFNQLILILQIFLCYPVCKTISSFST